MLELDGRRRIGKEIVMASQTDRQAGRHAICRNVVGHGEGGLWPKHHLGKGMFTTRHIITLCREL